MLHGFDENAVNYVAAFETVLNCYQFAKQKIELLQVEVFQCQVEGTFAFEVEEERKALILGHQLVRNGRLAKHFLQLSLRDTTPLVEQV